jgi:hypothetical protein
MLPAAVAPHPGPAEGQRRLKQEVGRLLSLRVVGHGFGGAAGSHRRCSASPSRPRRHALRAGCTCQLLKCKRLPKASRRVGPRVVMSGSR